MELSKRLQAVADLVTEGMTVADVGTDHGYIPIYLVKNEKSNRAWAMDVNNGPLLRAKAHIEAYGFCEQIQTIKSDGVKELQTGECDCVVIAGMGGALTIKILEEGEDIFRSLKEFVLQPQSEIQKVREYLYQQEYTIVEEDMVLEDGKFYPMMKVKVGQSSPYEEVEFRYGKCLLEKKHPVLKAFLEKEVQTKTRILHNLSVENGTHIETRKEELQKELEDIQYALQNYYGSD